MHSGETLAAAISAFERGDLDRSRSLVETFLVTEPPPPMAMHLMGLIECSCGRMAAGVEWLQRAHQASPASLPYRIMLARALVDSGRAPEALQVARPPEGVSIGPAELDLWTVRAEAAFRAGRRDIEAQAWQAICSARPAELAAWLNLARSLLSQNRFEEAAAAYRRALALQPANLHALHELGLTLERMNRLEELEILLDEALQAGISREGLADLWALRELRAGRADEAWRLARSVPADGDPIRINRLQAKAADAAGHSEEAFAAAVAMNRAVKDFDGWRSRAAEYRAELRRLAAATTPDWAAGLPKLSQSTQARPAFLLGFPRSGTTLVDTFLMGHPACRVIEEDPRLHDALHRRLPLRELQSRTGEDLEGARAAYLNELRKHIGTEFAGIVIDKFPLNMLAAPTIASVFPDAPIIFVQRHPCDAVLSGFMQSFEPGIGMASFLDIADAADFYDAAMSLWTASREALGLTVHCVVYEELVRSPEPVLRSLIGYLGLEWDERLMQHQIAAKKRGTILNTSYDQVTQPLTTAASGRWERYEKQLQPVMPTLLGWAHQLGYRG